MKNTLELSRLAFRSTFVAAMLFTGCAAQNKTPQLGQALGPVYETAEQIKAMPPCKAKVVQRAPCFVYLKAVDRKEFYLGSPGSKADVGRFLGVLKDGQHYDFPDVFLEYEKNQRRTEP